MKLTENGKELPGDWEVVEFPESGTFDIKDYKFIKGVPEKNIRFNFDKGTITDTNGNEWREIDRLSDGTRCFKCVSVPEKSDCVCNCGKSKYENEMHKWVSTYNKGHGEYAIGMASGMWVGFQKAIEVADKIEDDNQHDTQETCYGMATIVEGLKKWAGQK